MQTFFPRATYHFTSLSQANSPKPKISYKTQYFPQQLDHFTFQPNSYKIFYQKYLINNHYWQHGAPIFVYTGNEGDIKWFAANTGFLLDIAPKFPALLVFIEFAVLIRSLKQNLSSEASPVVVFGGSYGGMLAAWFRLKYPHIAIGALASSAPILHFDDITPRSSFYDAVSQDFKDASLNCFEVIKGSWAELEALSAQKGGLVELSRTFRTCKDLHSMSSAWDWLWSAFTYTAMVNYPMKANFLNPLPAYPVKQMCNIIDGFPPGASKLSRVFAAYEALTLVRHGTRYDTGHGDTSFLENLGYDTGGNYCQNPTPAHPHLQNSGSSSERLAIESNPTPPNGSSQVSHSSIPPPWMSHLFSWIFILCHTLPYSLKEVED
uniref:Lysosomal Pro-X carboxypeptidase n=1 Tax=Fagus sylvatica TaxID=28930 RepID=A0A2N9H7T8_FAGSY